MYIMLNILYKLCDIHILYIHAYHHTIYLIYYTNYIHYTILFIHIHAIGKMFLVDFESGQIISDNIIKESISNKYDYNTWLKDNLFSLEDWVNNSNKQVC